MLTKRNFTDELGILTSVSMMNPNEGLNDAYREKLCFTQFSTRMAASDLFYEITQSIKLYTFCYPVFKSKDV